MSQTLKEQAESASGSVVEVDRLEWLDQLDRANTPVGRRDKQKLLDLKAGAENTSAERVFITKADVLAVCGWEATGISNQ